jgi:hypothetical protein
LKHAVGANAGPIRVRKTDDAIGAVAVAIAVAIAFVIDV